MSIPKKQGTIQFRRTPDGYVSAVIVNRDGAVEVQKDVGVFTEAE
jgi:hypothetical protein